MLMGGSSLAAYVFDRISTSMLNAVFFLFVLVVLRILFRKDWIAVTAILVILGLANSNAQSPVGTILSGTIIFTFEYILLKRFGFIAVIVSLFVNWMVVTNPLTFRTFAWYSQSGVVMFALVAALAIYGFWTATPRQPFLDISRLEN